MAATLTRFNDHSALHGVSPSALTRLAMDTKASAGPSMPKKKPFPACDSCRWRRVACDPQPPPLSCQRCLSKGVRCTTTPGPRKGRKKGDGSDAAGQDAHSLLSFSHLPSYPGRPDAMETFDIPASLGRHLLELFRIIPHSCYLPVFPRGKLFALFTPESLEAVEGREVGLSAMGIPPDLYVLLYAIFALTCRVSSHPLFFSGISSDDPELAPPASAAAGWPPMVPATADALEELTKYGAARAPLCNLIHAKALWLAGRYHIATTSSPTLATLSACFLLAIAEDHVGNDSSSGLWSDAFVGQLRLMKEEDEQVDKNDFVSKMPLAWGVLLMREALSAINHLRGPRFVPQEYPVYLAHQRTLNYLIDLAPSLPSTLVNIREEEEAVKSGVIKLDPCNADGTFYAHMRAYCQHVLDLVKDLTEKVLNTVARKKSIDEPQVYRAIESIQSLRAILVVIDARAEFLVAPSSVAARRLSMAQELDFQYLLKSCLSCSDLALVSLLLPLWNELCRRHNSFVHVGQVLSVAGSHAARNQQQHLLASLEAMKEKLKPFVLDALKIAAVAISLTGLPHLSIVTSLQSYEKAEVFAEMLLQWELEGNDDVLDARPERMSDWIGEGSLRFGKLGRLEKATLLDSFANTMKARAWAWEEQRAANRPSLIEQLETAATKLRAGTPTSSSGSGSDGAHSPDSMMQDEGSPVQRLLQQFSNAVTGGMNRMSNTPSVGNPGFHYQPFMQTQSLLKPHNPLAPYPDVAGNPFGFPQVLPHRTQMPFHFDFSGTKTTSAPSAGFYLPQTGASDSSPESIEADDQAQGYGRRSPVSDQRSTAGTSFQASQQQQQQLPSFPLPHANQMSGPAPTSAALVRASPLQHIQHQLSSAASAHHIQLQQQLIAQQQQHYQFQAPTPMMPQQHVQQVQQQPQVMYMYSQPPPSNPYFPWPGANFQ